jgi:hypothetical protein
MSQQSQFSVQFSSVQFNSVAGEMRKEGVTAKHDQWQYDEMTCLKN